jgi:POT family proton-dependent oligopeptide transporter
VSIVLATVNWKRIADLDTPLLHVSATQYRTRVIAGVLILVGLVPLVWFLLQRGGSTETLFKWAGLAVFLVLLWLTLKHPDPLERNNMWAYLVLGFGSLVFWSLYQMAPNGLQLFAVHNVDLHVAGITIAPQWVQNINTVVIVLGGPLLAVVFVKLRERGWRVDIPQQFALSLLLMGLAFLVLPVGIGLAGGARVAFFWLFLSYVLQSVGELLISPVGYAMIGKLAPRQYQGIMMGSWMLVTGLASLYAGDFSGMIPEPTGTTPAATNPEYASLFAKLGWGSAIVGVVLAILIPFLRRLIKDRPVQQDDARAPLLEAARG